MMNFTKSMLALLATAATLHGARAHGAGCGVCDVSAVCNTNIMEGCPQGVWNSSNPLPEIISWHIHIMFNGDANNAPNDPAHGEAGALELAASFRQEFGPMDNCTMLMDDGKAMCEFPYDDEPGVACAGPFYTKTAAFSIPTDDFEATVGYMMQHRGTYDILVHPNTGCLLNDHLEWSLWAGTQWPIRFFFP